MMNRIRRLLGFSRLTTGATRQIVSYSTILLMFGAVGTLNPGHRSLCLLSTVHGSGPILALTITSAHESLRDALIRMQSQTGLTLASFDKSIEIVLFDKRELVPSPNSFYRIFAGVVTRDGTEIAAARLNQDMTDSLVTFRPEGGAVREYPVASSQTICWSYDKSKLAVAVASGARDPGLQIVDVATRVASPKIDPMAELSSQCWSPDGKKIVYVSGDSIKIYDVEKYKSVATTLIKGQYPTWSPDGNWIAFLDHDTYYAVRPDGSEKRKLFHHSNVYSPLWWSPDSRIVAYIALRFALDDFYQLRVRRLEDSSEERVAEGQIGGRRFQWVISPELNNWIRPSVAAK
jgi:hypothetical protein